MLCALTMLVISLDADIPSVLETAALNDTMDTQSSSSHGSRQEETDRSQVSFCYIHYFSTSIRFMQLIIFPAETQETMARSSNLSSRFKERVFLPCRC